VRVSEYSVSYETLENDPMDGNLNSDLSRQLSVKMAQIYAETVGSLEPLIRQSGLDCSEADLLAGNVNRLATEALRRFSVPLISRIAAVLNRADGRDPMGATDWSVVLYCLGGARTLREAISRCMECFEAISLRMGRMSLRTRSDTAMLQLDSLRAAPSVAGCAIDLHGVINFHGILGWLIADRLPATTIALDYDRSLFAAMALPNWPVPLLLEAGWTGFAFPAAYLDYPVARTGGEVVDWPRHSFLFDVENLEQAGAFADQVRRLAYRSLCEHSRLPSFEQVVRSLRTSTATLRRRLADEGTSYRSLKISCRRELGLELLRSTTLTIEQISDRLSFCDSDAFRRSFREWMGTSPSRYRQGAKPIGNR